MDLLTNCVQLFYITKSIQKELISETVVTMDWINILSSLLMFIPLFKIYSKTLQTN